MKALLLIITLLIANTNRSSAQKWAPLGMTWTYSFVPDYWGPDIYPVVWEAYDTVFTHGHLCTIVKPKYESLDTFRLARYSSLITYEDSGVVYLYSPLTGRFSTLYDFNKKVGEGWEISGIEREYSRGDTMTCKIAVVVDSIQTVVINGTSLRKLFLSSAPGSLIWSFDGAIIEGIGHLTRPIPWNTCYREPVFEGEDCGRMWDCANHYFGLRCIDNGELGFYDFKRVPYCDYKRTEIDEQKQEIACTLFPNPARGFFTIQLKDNAGSGPYFLSVRNQLGQTVFTQQIKQETTSIEAHWPPGMYFYQLTSEGVPAASGKIALQ
jgi:hypothetical protein